MKFLIISTWLIALSTLLLPDVVQSKLGDSANAKRTGLLLPNDHESSEQDHRLAKEVTFAQPPPSETSNTIVGGTSQTTQIPWLVNIASCDAAGFNCGTCGASLVAKDVVLTAAHCVDNHKLVPTIAVAGALYLDWGLLMSDGTQVYPVSGSLLIHPNWDESKIYMGYDLALFKIIPDSSVNDIVSLNGDTNAPSNGQALSVYGFGRTDNDDPSSASVSLKRLDTDARTCTLSVSGAPDLHVCTLATPASSGACQGDSGGPLVTSQNPDVAVQVGITSYAFGDGAYVTCANGFDDVFTDVASHYSWIQDYICVNSDFAPSSCFTPTPDPTPDPTTPDPTTPDPTSDPTTPTTPRTPSPTPEPTPDPGCFSSVDTVEVLGEGNVAMKDLRIGAKVFTGTTNSGKKIYQPIYSFGHRKDDQPAEFLRIHTSSSSKSLPLEITGNHLLFIAGKADPVRADMVKVGDMLMYQSSQSGFAEQVVKVTRIQKIFRQGAYQPLTPDGTLVVSGIHVSAYASDDDCEVFSGMVSGFMSQQTQFHLWLSPFRMLCLGVSSRFGNGPYSSKGTVYWEEFGERVTKVFNGSTHGIKVLLIVLFVTLLGAVNLVEMTFGPRLGSLVLVGVGFFLAWRILAARKLVPEKKMKTS